MRIPPILESITLRRVALAANYPEGPELEIVTVWAAGLWWGSTGYPNSTQASNPPSSGRTSLYPWSSRSRAILALVASFGQVQYITTGRPVGISP
jgi:hypothetical protein